MTTRTAAERRADARTSHLTRVADCPTNRLLERIGEKWVSLVLKELADGPRRYGDLARTIASASPKMLTQTLRRLERDGLLSRTVTPAVPVRVEYALTPLGQSLMPVLYALSGWAERNIEQVEAARRSYDVAQRSSS
ncbi:transcriptional regulator [Streptomyces camponoticapitis]|uniref:Transcriptional regulator n=1 Tax=Streptomyces camponoticapitis TaxID=1616125 RepID=A0ABQ2E8R5_9ACTN|nr:helix-turn-helix domain-containing protein [Streptomyces camponoticapitis]GGJ97539.1 transcriptional regulator [Streptomyces camponoticapitis]